MPVTTTSPSVAGRRPWLVRQQLPYLQRGVRWRPIVGATGLASLMAQADFPPVLVLAIVAGGLALVLDDPAAAILDATPAARPRRRWLRLGLTVPVTAVLWLAVVQPLWSLRTAAPPVGPANLALAALVAVVLAGAAIGGGAAGAPAALAVALAGFTLPAPLTLPVAPGQSRNWTIVLTLAVGCLVIASRDPGTRPRRRR